MRKLFTLIVVAALCILSVSAAAYSIDGYNVSVKVSKDAIHTVTEDISVNFIGKSHGIIRYIPLENGGRYLDSRISDLEVNQPYEKSTEDGFLVLKTGVPTRYADRHTQYTFSYKTDVGYDPNEGYDQFYFNIIGSGWDVTIYNASFEIEFPSTSFSDVTFCDVLCGDRKVDFDVEKRGDGFVIKGECSYVSPGEALTIGVSLPEGWYQGARQPWSARGFFNVFSVLLLLVCPAACYFIWSTFGRDRVPVVLARYEAPEGFSPLVVGYIADGTVDDKDITSMLYYWADKGYLFITEKKKGVFTFTKITEPENCPEYEKQLFRAFFRNADSNGTVDLERLGQSNFYEAMMKVRLEIRQAFSKDKALKKASCIKYQILSFFIGILPLVSLTFAAFLDQITGFEAFACCLFSLGFSFLFFGLVELYFERYYVRKRQLPMQIGLLCLALVIMVFGLVIGFSNGVNFFSSLLCPVSTLCCVFFACITSKRSAYGDEMLEEVLGYREFIDKVELDRLNTMIESDPELFYHVLSYAVVLGLEESWAKKFTNIAVAQPSWYRGRNDMLDALYFSHLCSRMNTSIRNNSMSAAVRDSKALNGSSLHTGFTAGGGFGGGGGRAW